MSGLSNRGGHITDWDGGDDGSVAVEQRRRLARDLSAGLFQQLLFFARKLTALGWLGWGGHGYCC